MKKCTIFLIIGLFSLFLFACEKYLDRAPESNFSEEEVFSNYSNFLNFFDAIYDKGRVDRLDEYSEYNLRVSYNLYFASNPRKFSFDQLTDLSDGGRIRENQVIKSGTMGNYVRFFYDNTREGRPHISVMFNVIRICNLTLQKVGNLKNVDQENIDDLIAQAYFCRAYAHYCLFRFWGPMPYITHVIGPYDNWDLPRLTKRETCVNIAADFDTAFTYFDKANRIRRDNPAVGGAGHLNHPDQFRPTGVASKALKAHVLLYSASPLNNESGNIDYWEEAAAANWEAIQLALDNGYFLLSAANYKQNFIGTNYSDEQLWGWAAGPIARNSQLLMWLINGVFSGDSGGSSGENPTQNTIDKFETKWGDPLYTQEDRDAAALLGHYNEQDPYANRDPRFYIDIIYNQATIPGFNTAQIYYEDISGVITYSELLNQKVAGITRTGYYQNKMWGGQSVKNNISPLHTDPIIRLAEVYLNYAEAVNEAYGPNTPAPGATLTAVQAINLIRQRAGQVDVQPQFTTTKEAFRARIKNERIIELCFEGHYFFDIRRWKDAPVTMAGPLMGMSIKKVPVSSEYPIGFQHIRMPLPADRQSIWKDEMYYLPFYEADYYKMRNFDCSLNPRW